MAKPLKIVLSVVVGLLLLLIAAAIALPLLFDPNDYRDQIAQVVKKETGRELSLGDIKLQVFPWLRVAIKDATLGNASGFGAEPFAQVGQVNVGVKLLPLLFNKQIQVSTLQLDGLRLNLAKDAQGRSNWDDLLAAQEKKPEEPPADEPGSSFDLSTLDIGGLEINEAEIQYQDAQAKSQYRVAPLQLKTGNIRPGEPVDVTTSLGIESSAPPLKGTFKLAGTVTPKLDQQAVTVEDLVLSFKGNGFDMALDTELKGRVAADLLKQLVSVDELAIKLQAKNADFDLAAMVSAQLNADLKAMLFGLSSLKVDGTIGGKSIPGGNQKVALSSNVIAVDQKQGTLKIDALQAQALGLALKASILGKGIAGDHPQLSGPISIASFNPRDVLSKLDQALDTADKTALTQASLNADYDGSFTSAGLRNLKLQLDQTQVTGMLAVRDFATAAAEFALKIDSIDADRYLPPKAAETPAGKSAEKDGDINSIRLPTDLIEQLNANGTLDIGQLKINGLKLSDVQLKLSGSGKTAAKQQNLSAKLYGGNISLSNRVVPGKSPAYTLNTQLTALKAAPFLQDLLGKDYVSGLGNISLALTSHGQTVGDVRRALNGDVSMKFEQGAVKGFNLGQILRKGQAALAGNLNYSEDTPKETDFSAISVSGKIVNGVLKTDDLSAASPAFRLAGAGEIDLVKETINYLAQPTVVESSRGEGGKGLEELKGLTIPIKLSGSLFDPKYKLDVETALKQKATEKLRDELKGREDEIKEKINDKLGELLFGKKKQPAPAAEPEPAPAQ
jgi:AsmA protein